MKTKDEIIEELRNELKWYGKCIAGGAPLSGYKQAARKAENRWYQFTLTLLEESGDN